MIGILIGVVAGILGGFMGIGGGIVMIPALVFFLGFDQHSAQGTTLAAMVPPIGLFAAYVYYQKGYVNIPLAACIAFGFLAGGLVGASFAVGIDEVMLRKGFGVALLLLSLYLIFWK
ncbi:MAG: sulfite exporter TauE/SafE family protein [Spirochaetes bacterium]|nr:MAG: sulfite exporter TauE/SafE family protein [Spirochaetota bacterium]